jgi:hypothetical protein
VGWSDVLDRELVGVGPINLCCSDGHASRARSIWHLTASSKSSPFHRSAYIRPSPRPPSLLTYPPMLLLRQAESIPWRCHHTITARHVHRLPRNCRSTLCHTEKKSEPDICTTYCTHGIFVRLRFRFRTGTATARLLFNLAHAHLHARARESQNDQLQITDVIHPSIHPASRSRTTPHHAQLHNAQSSSPTIPLRAEICHPTANSIP